MTSYVVTIGRLFRSMRPTDTHTHTHTHTHTEYGYMSRIMIGFMWWEAVQYIEF